MWIFGEDAIRFAGGMFSVSASGDMHGLYRDLLQPCKCAASVLINVLVTLNTDMDDLQRPTSSEAKQSIPEVSKIPVCGIYDELDNCGGPIRCKACCTFGGTGKPKDARELSSAYG